jgi:hypothetical protein
MRRQACAALAALIAAGMAFAVLSAPASAQTSGNETFKGVIVASGVSGERVVVSSVIVAKGVFSGVGRIVELPNQPGDPENVNRDELVFADGSIEIVSTIVDFSFSVNPHSCVFTGTIQQTGEIVGGTGLLADASGSYTATLTGHGLLARNPDGSCAMEQEPLHEVDKISASGTLSF